MAKKEIAYLNITITFEWTIYQILKILLGDI